MQFDSAVAAHSIPSVGPYHSSIDRDNLSAVPQYAARGLRSVLPSVQVQIVTMCLTLRVYSAVGNCQSVPAGIEKTQLSIVCLCSTTAQPLPTAYASITPDCLPAELYPGMNTVEYTLPQVQGAERAPLLVFVVDLCIAPDEMELLKVRPPTASVLCSHCMPRWLLFLAAFGTTLVKSQLFKVRSTRVWFVQTCPAQSMCGPLAHGRAHASAGGPTTRTARI